MLRIGPHTIEHPAMLAPMAGITDRPFRQMCRRLGASYAVSEMLSCDLSLLKTAKSQFRRNHTGEPAPIAVQIAGADPQAIAQAAQQDVENGAQIIDINMGCPAKKVAKKKCGSALLAEPQLVQQIIQATVNAVDVPVTLKTRLGTDEDNKNIHQIAEIAEQNGIQALFIHGRTKQQKYTGKADYTLIAEVKKNLTIPVIANGDIDSADKARQVLEETGCDAIMVGRAAQGNPWIFREIRHHLRCGGYLPRPCAEEIIQVMHDHVLQLHLFYGEFRGCRIARKHIKWFLEHLQLQSIARIINQIDNAEEQLEFIQSKLLKKVA